MVSSARAGFSCRPVRGLELCRQPAAARSAFCIAAPVVPDPFNKPLPRSAVDLPFLQLKLGVLYSGLEWQRKSATPPRGSLASAMTRSARLTAAVSGDSDPPVWGQPYDVPHVVRAAPLKAGRGGRTSGVLTDWRRSCACGARLQARGGDAAGRSHQHQSLRSASK